MGIYIYRIPIFIYRALVFLKHKAHIQQACLVSELRSENLCGEGVKRLLSPINCLCHCSHQFDCPCTFPWKNARTSPTTISFHTAFMLLVPTTLSLKHTEKGHFTFHRLFAINFWHAGSYFSSHLLPKFLLSIYYLAFI